ncbi:radical SAM protein [Candidatus Woesearchaeota archaeon]|nr:radical SAM protein [Candidatus Woesearchaeota archaeon]
MKSVYGPVPSWRLGISLGIDGVCRSRKTCSFDCSYCQLGKTLNKTAKRTALVSEKKVKRELKKEIKKAKADVVTISGTGEPTLNKNLGKIIDSIREVTDLPIAILTNSSLIYRKDVQKDLKKLDIVVAKLDAPNEKLFRKINKPAKGITFKKVLKGLKEFRKGFKGKLALQMMFIGKNKNYAAELAKLAREIKPDEVQINTPLRPCAEKPLSRKELKKIKSKFKGLNVVSVYEAKRPKVKILSIHDTMIRRGRKIYS